MEETDEKSRHDSWEGRYLRGMKLQKITINRVIHRHIEQDVPGNVEEAAFGFSFGDGSKMQKAGRGTPGTGSPAGN